MTSKLKTMQTQEMQAALPSFSPLLPPERCDFIVCPVELQEQPERFQSDPQPSPFYPMGL